MYECMSGYSVLCSDMCVCVCLYVCVCGRCMYVHECMGVYVVCMGECDVYIHM